MDLVETDRTHAELLLYRRRVATSVYFKCASPGCAPLHPCMTDFFLEKASYPWIPCLQNFSSGGFNKVYSIKLTLALQLYWDFRHSTNGPASTFPLKINLAALKHLCSADSCLFPRQQGQTHPSSETGPWKPPLTAALACQSQCKQGDSRRDLPLELLLLLGSSCWASTLPFWGWIL